MKVKYSYFLMDEISLFASLPKSWSESEIFIHTDGWNEFIFTMKSSTIWNEKRLNKWSNKEGKEERRERSIHSKLIYFVKLPLLSPHHCCQLLAWVVRYVSCTILLRRVYILIIYFANLLICVSGLLTEWTFTTFALYIKFIYWILLDHKLSAR